MSATAQDYIATSKAIFNARSPNDPQANKACDRIALELAKWFRRGNPKFRADVFLRGCGVKVARQSEVTA